MIIDRKLDPDTSFIGNQIIGLADAPGLSTAEMEDKFDAAMKNVMVPAFNGLIDDLNAIGIDYLLTGWIPITDTWVYASTSGPNITVAVPAGAQTKYKAGMGVKYTQTTLKYGYIVSIPTNTSIVINGGTDYVVLSTPAISAISYAPNPQNAIGFPEVFTYLPTYSASGSMTWGSISTTYAKFSIAGRKCFFWVYALGTIGGTPATQCLFTVPVKGINTINGLGGFGCLAYSAGSGAGGISWFSGTDGTKIALMLASGANFAGGGQIGGAVNGWYDI